MIVRYCDGCGVELKTYALIEAYPKRISQSPERSYFKYELCDNCYDKVKTIIKNMPENKMRNEV